MIYHARNVAEQKRGMMKSCPYALTIVDGLFLVVPVDAALGTVCGAEVAKLDAALGVIVEAVARLTAD